MTLLDYEITGSDLPDQTLCFTYDDGPADQTAELAQFLYEKDVTATFFLVGQHIEDHKNIRETLVRLGHRIANHTYNHANLVEDDDPQVTVNRCNELIAPYVRSDLFYLRPPYGAWSPDVAEKLNNDEDLSARHYKGPVNWHIGGTKSSDHEGYNADWYCWETETGAEECGDAYMREIDDKGQGIVLMHDYGEDKEITDSNTLHLTQYLVPALKEKGYQFYPLHWVPQIADLNRDDGDENAMPENWFDVGRGAHVDWHQIIINGGHTYYAFERACSNNELFWNGEKLAGEGKEIAGRADVDGLVFIFFMGLEDDGGKIWYQSFKPGNKPSNEFKEFEPGTRTIGLRSLHVIPETSTLKFEFWGAEDEPKIWSREQTKPGSDEWGELKDETEQNC